MNPRLQHPNDFYRVQSILETDYIPSILMHDNRNLCDYTMSPNWEFGYSQTLLPLSTFSLQDGRLSGRLDSSTGLLTVTVVGVPVVIVAVIEAVTLLTEVAGCFVVK